MASGNPKLSALLEALIEKGLFDRLPVTFSTFFYSQIQEWELLFPAEKILLRAAFHSVGPFRSGRSRSAVSRRARCRATDGRYRLGVAEAHVHAPASRFSKPVSALCGMAKRYTRSLRQGRSVAGCRGRPPWPSAACHRPLVRPKCPLARIGCGRVYRNMAGRCRLASHPRTAADYVPLLLTGKPLAAHAPSISDLYRGREGSASPTRHGASKTGDRLASMSTHAGVVRLSYRRLSGISRAPHEGSATRLVENEQIRDRTTLARA